MFNTIRKHQRVLMLIVVILTILAFTFFYTRTDSVQRGGDGIGMIYGRALSQIDIQRLAANYRIAHLLGLSSLLESLGGLVRDEPAALSNFVFNQLIIQHEAKSLGIEPEDNQVAQAIAGRPIFQTDGHFDVSKYRNFIRDFLEPRGFREQQLEELVRDSLRVTTLWKIVAGGVGVSDQEIRNAFRGYQKQTLQVIKFDLSQYTNKVSVPEEKVVALYGKEAGRLILPETRSIRYVIFEVPKEKEILVGGEKVKAIQETANQAETFAESLLQAKMSFDEAARKNGLTVNTSLPFNRAGVGPGAESFQGDLPKLAPTIFQLTRKQPHSEALEGSDKMRFYVCELSSVTPSKPMTFEEARPQLLEVLRNQAAIKLLYDEGQAALTSIAQKLRQGESLQAAASGLAAQVQEISDTALYSSSSPEDALYNEIALFLSPGQMSALQPSIQGAFAVFLQKRVAINPSEFDQKKEMLKAQLLQNKQTLLFFDWLRAAREKANLRITQS
ncbi:MAG: hypothetical protein C5B47_05185 [Verrucomicrobia bacterium]|nr:MAG: hypothetical protein C5B47_05185 [Verrucomicrobiota bacterium]